jgi:hypothetical protein
MLALCVLLWSHFVWEWQQMGLRMKGLESITSHHISSPLLLVTEKGFVVWWTDWDSQSRVMRVYWCVKSSSTTTMVRVYFTIFQSQGVCVCGRYIDFLVDFLLLENCKKIGFGRKNEFSPSMCSHLGQL